MRDLKGLEEVQNFLLVFSSLSLGCQESPFWVRVCRKGMPAMDGNLDSFTLPQKQGFSE